MDKQPTRGDDHGASYSYSRIGLAVAAFAGAFAIVGSFVMTAPIVLLIVALASVLWELRYRARRRTWHRKWAYASYASAVLAFLVAFYVAWYVFAIDMNLEFVGVVSPPSGHEFWRFAVKVTNVEKPTSLTDWQAFLKMPNGTSIPGEILGIRPGDSVEIVTANHISTKYVLPDCDLIFETTRAMQTGDTVYGIIQFSFDIPWQLVPLDAGVVLQAKDMLGRTVRSQPMTIRAAKDAKPHLFPCRTKDDP